MTHDFKRHRDELQELMRGILYPDLLANGVDRLHIVLASETDLRLNGEFGGLSSPFLHRYLGRYVPGWSSACPTVLVADRSYATKSTDPAADFVGVVTHEFAHVVDTPGLFARDEYLPDAPGDDRLFAQRVSIPAKEWCTLPSPSPRIGHGPSFLRACLHLRHRLGLRGVECNMPRIVDSWYYAIQPLAIYRRKLDGECERLEHLSLTEIQQKPIPQSFLDQWNDDCQNWPDAKFTEQAS